MSSERLGATSLSSPGTGPSGGLAVGVLGPLEVSTGGRPVVVTTRRLRTVLAALAVSADRTVSVDRLGAVVWDPDEDPPDDVRRTVQTYVTRLRGLLGAGSIGTRPEGYVLHAEPDRVDALRLDRLLDAASAAPDRVTERGLLAEALALWRGEPFSGISSAWLAQSEQPRLVERYLTAVERRIDLDLDSGRHGELGPQLRALTARYPLRETLWERLLVVLARCGRQAEALDRYETIRRRLADDLGVDPGPELQQIYADLLAGSTPTAGSVAGPATAVPVVPRQLPADVTGFAGRTDHLEEMDGLLPRESGSAATRAAVIVVHGTAGVGKSALAVHWAHRVRDRFPDGQLYVNLRGFDPSDSVVSTAEVLAGFLDALGVPQHQTRSGVQAQLGRYRSALAAKRVLVVLDNARDAEQVRPLLPGCPGCLVVVTTRNELPGLVAIDGAHPIVLDLPTADEARTLLARRIGPDRVAAEPEPAEEIIAGCARLPLALAIVAARAAIRPAFPLATLATELRARGGLRAFAAGDEAIDVRNVFSWSYHGLSTGAARLFRRLGLHPGPDLAAPAAASLAGLPLPEAQALLDELAHAHLVNEHVPGRYTFHDLLRAYATELVHTHDNAADSRAAMRRMLDHYLHAADAAAQLLDPHRLPISVDEPVPGITPAHPRDAAAAIDWLTAEHRVLLGAIRQAGDHGFEAYAWRLAATLVEFLARRGRWHEFADVQRIAVSAAERLADQVGQAHAYHNLGRAHGKLGRYDDAQACYLRALSLFRVAGDHAGQASAHLGISWLSGRRRRFPDAIHHGWRALHWYRASGDQVGQANARNAIGWYHAQAGEYTQALAHCRVAVTLHSGLADRQGEANTWDSMGYAHHHLGDHQQAVGCYRRAVALYRQAGDRYGEADTLTRLGDTHRAAGNPHRARASWRRAARILDELGHPDAELLNARLTAPWPGTRGSAPAGARR
jgi:DNA-binding SARP family transcriptional activator/tetratricopeptide (TPR) repeat protein